MIKADFSQASKLEHRLKGLSRSGIRFAERNTMNDAAFDSRKEAQELVRNKFVNRNNWTVRSIRAEKGNIRTMTAKMGSVQDYMEVQEFGKTERKRGKEGVAIPTTYSSGEGEKAGVRRRLPRKANKLVNIQLKNKRTRAKSQKQENLIKVKQAAKSGNKYVFMRLSRGRKGIFRVLGKRKIRVKMVHDLSRTSVRIPKQPWMKPAVKKTVKKMPRMYKKHLIHQIRRAMRR